MDGFINALQNIVSTMTNPIIVLALLAIEAAIIGYTMLMSKNGHEVAKHRALIAVIAVGIIITAPQVAAVVMGWWGA